MNSTRKLTNALLLALAMTSASVAASGCNNACLKTAASRTSAVMLIADANLALDQASAVIAAIMNQDLRDKGIAALAVARAALRAADKSLQLVDSKCTSPDVGIIFQDFVAAWQALVPFLTLMGGPAGSQVPAPLVVEMAH